MREEREKRGGWMDEREEGGGMREERESKEEG